MSPHPSLTVVLDILAVRIDLSPQNSRMHELPKVRALQVTLTGSNCECSCQTQTHGEPCEINNWDLIEGLMRFNDNKNVMGMQEKLCQSVKVIRMQ